MPSCGRGKMVAKTIWGTTHILIMRLKLKKLFDFFQIFIYKKLINRNNYVENTLKYEIIKVKFQKIRAVCVNRLEVYDFFHN